MLDFGAGSMTREELYKFLMGSMRFASLATLRKDGSPFVVPLGYWYDGEHMYFTFAPTRGSVLRLRRDPRAAVTVYSCDFPVKFVAFCGDAEEVPDPDHEMSLRIHRRTPKDHAVDADEYEHNWLSTGKVVFRVRLADYSALDLTKIENLASEGAMTPLESKNRRFSE